VFIVALFSGCAHIRFRVCSALNGRDTSISVEAIKKKFAATREVSRDQAYWTTFRTRDITIFSRTLSQLSYSGFL